MNRLIILTIVFAILNSQCQPNNLVQGIYSGSIQLVLNNNNSVLTYTYEYPQNMTSVPNIAISLQGFSLRQLTIREWLVRPNSITQASTDFLFVYDENLWSYIRIGFIVSTVPQLLMGQQTIFSNSLNRQLTQIKSIQFQEPILNFNTSIGRTFINGISLLSQTSNILINIYKIQISQNSIQFTVQFNQFTLIRLFSISYVVFSPSEVPFSNYGGGFLLTDFNQTTKIDNLHKSIYFPTAILSGIVSLQLTSSQSITFNSNFDNQFNLNVSTTSIIDNIVLAYIVIGVSPSQVCRQCNQSIIFNNTCVKECPDSSNIYQYQYSDSTIGCRSCPAQLNLIYNNQTQKCQCQEGFQLNNGICESPDPNQNIRQMPSLSQQAFEQPQLPRIRYVERDCSQIQNTYWTGYRCACKVGFVTKNGVCGDVVPSDYIQQNRPVSFTYVLPIIDNITIRCQLPNEEVSVQNGTCVCKINYIRNKQGECQLIQCPNFSILRDGQCICNAGFRLQTSQSQSQQIQRKCVRICPNNSLDNGLGFCVCIQGYTNNQTGQQCTPICNLSLQNFVNGVCVCRNGYNRINGTCQRCPPGLVFINGQCINSCGERQVFNETKNKCVCEEGYGRYRKICTTCPQGYFIFDGYCATCQLNSIYNSSTRECICREGFSILEGGSCESLCVGRHQIFEAQTQKCKCIQGLQFINPQQCDICPHGVDPSTNICKPQCNNTTQITTINGCKCINEFGYDENKVCIRCSQFNKITVNGICASCPNTYIISNNRCVCKEGQREINGICIGQCQPNQLIDASGNCFQCPLLQVKVNSACECRLNYVRDSNGRCIISCPSNKFIQNGLCASCALNTVYNAQLNACVCAQGYYKNNFQFCERGPLDCSIGFYLDSSTRSCQQCSNNCRQCSSVRACSSCVQGYVIVNGLCVLVENEVNGNGRIEGVQECDDGNVVDGDGCSSTMQVQDSYVCVGQPSSCVLYSLKLDRDILFNFNNAFIILKTSPSFTFQTQEEGQDFIKVQLQESVGSSSSTRCVQDMQDVSLFSCLVIFISGLPASPFSASFSYQFERRVVRLDMQIDPPTLNLSRRPR